MADKLRPYRITYKYEGTMEVEATSESAAESQALGIFDSASSIFNALDMEEDELYAEQLDEDGHVI